MEPEVPIHHQSSYHQTVFQQIGKIVIDIFSIGFCHFYHCVHNSTGLGSVWCIAEQPVFTADCKWADRIFTEIIRKTAAAVFQIGGQIGAAILNVGDSFIPFRNLHSYSRKFFCFKIFYHLLNFTKLLSQHLYLFIF